MEQFKDVNRRKSKHKEKLNIAMFGQKRIPSREGGVEIVVEELCSRMVAQGHNVTCYNRGGHHVSGSEYDSKRLKEYKGIRLKTVPTIEKKGLAAVSSSFFAALCCAFGRYDIVHIHAEGPAFFAWLPKLFGKKVIVTIHGLDWQREKWKSGFGSKFIHQGEKNAVKYADEIKRKAADLGISEHVTFVGNVGNANEWYQAFDCFVLPSIWEGLPVVGVEAQAADLPCVFSSAITREIGLSQHAKFVPLTESVSVWAKTLSDALQQNERNDNTKLITEHHYNIAFEAKNLQERYLQLAGEVK